MTRLDATFIALIGVQAAHSIEEYFGRLYDVFPPARFVSSLISQVPQRGFAILSVALVLFGIWCFLWPIRRRWPSAKAFGWIWVVVGLVNGISHPLWSLSQLQYTPGVATAPILLIIALYLARQLHVDSTAAAA